MRKWIVALGASAALSMLPMDAFADQYRAGDAVLGGIVGGVVGGLIGSVVAPYPVYVEPAPVVVKRYGPPVVVYEGRPYRWSHRHRYDRHRHDHHRHDRGRHGRH